MLGMKLETISSVCHGIEIASFLASLYNSKLSTLDFKFPLIFDNKNLKITKKLSYIRQFVESLISFRQILFAIEHLMLIWI